MRVIAGKAKGRKLMMVPGDTTRPITDRAKEALFSILGRWVVDARVLDLFGGTGAVGIEALSRGAAHAHFLDLGRKAVDTIQANVAHCGFAAQAVVEKADAFLFLERYRGKPFDLIYIAPPQYQEYWSKALKLVDSRPELLGEGGVVIVQIHPKEFHAVDLAFLEEYDERKYGSTALRFYASAVELAAEAEESDGEEEWDDEFNDEWLDDEDGEDEEIDEDAGAGESPAR
jgi:16S rRNA (guanine(966)-N(2))-methyltransferase RsmD